MIRSASLRTHLSSLDEGASCSGHRILTTIGLLLITRNEIGNRASGFREAVRSFEEFLVVDTGSTDDTVAVARNLGATVIHHTWSDDFSAARNTGYLFIPALIGVIRVPLLERAGLAGEPTS